MANMMGAIGIKIKVNLHIIINQAWGEYETKKEKLKVYLQIVLNKKDDFNYFNVSLVRQAENQVENKVDRIASVMEESPLPK